MGWTVRSETENGKPIRTLPNEFVLSETELIKRDQFKLLRYLDPYGDTTFNSLMFTDLATDLIALKLKLPNDQEQIDEVLQLLDECNNEVHIYLKFIGD